MITFKINGKPYKIPTEWTDVTYSQYFQLIRSQTLTDHISIFTGIPRGTLETSELKNLEKISLALSFLSFTPEFKRTKMVGPYVLPTDVTIQSTRQMEDLRSLLLKIPKDLSTLESAETLCELYLLACAIYCQKVRDGKYDAARAEAMTHELQGYSVAEVNGTGGFFLFKPPPSLQRSMTLFQKVIQLLKRSKRA